MTLNLSDLTVVLPYHNAKTFIENSLPHLKKMAELGSQLIFVDDCSNDGGADILREALSDFNSVKTLQLETNQGAGIARNFGLPYAERQYILFFDIDDLIDLEVLNDALNEAKKTNCDVQISTFLLQDENGSPRKTSIIDQEIFSALHKNFVGATFNVSHHPAILRLTNYPWNKLILTEFAKTKNVKFGATRVQNDVFAHWSAILNAKSINFYPKPYTTHIVSETFNQITNDFGENRLQLFDALEQVENELFSDEGHKLVAGNEFLAFKTELVSWAKQRLKPEVMQKFETRARKHVLKTRIRDLIRFNSEHPNLAARYARHARN